MAQFKSVPMPEKPDDHSVVPEIGMQTFETIFVVMIVLAALAVFVRIGFRIMRRRRKAAINAMLAEELGPDVDIDTILKAGARGDAAGE